MAEKKKPAAFGGEGFSPRTASLREELGSLWSDCGVCSEWGELKSVLLHRPGPELARSSEPDRVLMLEPVDPGKAQAQHDALAETYREVGVQVYSVVPPGFERSRPPPNLMFVADLIFMTPQGAILGRPASTVRAGEERLVARRLADLGIPIVMSVHGKGTFEGADAAWLNEETVLLARGLRTNPEGAGQVASVLTGMGVNPIQVDLPGGFMHLMGQLRFLDDFTAVIWPGGLPEEGLEALRANRFEILTLPDEKELADGMAMNFVTVSRRRIVMPAGNPATQSFLERKRVHCSTVDISELKKAAGGIGCLTGVLQRD
jgi:arginine deiminase